jgi:hypothetical protein
LRFRQDIRAIAYPKKLEITVNSRDSLDSSRFLNLAQWTTEQESPTETPAKKTVWTEVKYPTGQLQARFPFVEGQLHGVADYWFENGVKSASIPWFKGQMHGRAKFYTEANRLRQTNSYRLGKLHGLSSWYDDKGEVTYRALYEEDQVLSCDRNILDALAKKVGE